MKGRPPGQRTAVVFTGSGASGAYHAGVLKALDAAGVRIDVMVGSGVGALAAAFGAAAAGSALYGEAGLWRGLTSRRVFRLRPGLRFLRALGIVALCAFLVPALLALLFGLMLPVFLAVDLASPGFMSRILQITAAFAPALRLFFVMALAAPTFIGLLFVLIRAAVLLRTTKRRLGEALESAFDLSEIERDLARRLWEVARGPALDRAMPTTAEIGRHYAALIAENAGQPGFRGLVLRAADLDANQPLVLKLAADDPAGDTPRPLPSEALAPVDLQDPEAAPLLADLVVSSFGSAPLAAARRVRLPKQGAYASELHRITGATAMPGTGIGDAIALGADRIVLVTGAASEQGPKPERRGLRAMAGALLDLQERAMVEADLRQTERLNRIVETVGHQRSTGQREWQDPLTGRRFRSVTLHVVRPRRPLLRPLDLDGSIDPATEVETSLLDWMDEGERDAHRCFLDAVLEGDDESGLAQTVLG